MDQQPTDGRQYMGDRVSSVQPTVKLEGKAPVSFISGDGGRGGDCSPSSTSSSSSSAAAAALSPALTESLLDKSWSTVGDVDVEFAKSLDAREENHSFNSDIVHVGSEEVEMLKEAERRTVEEELQLSVLGGEKELMELRDEEEDEDEDEEEDDEELQAPETELLVSAEEPHLEREPSEFRQVVPPMALPLLPILKLDPPSTTSTPVPSNTSYEAEQLFSGLCPPSILAPMGAEPVVTAEKFSQIALSDEEEPSGSPSFPKTPKPFISTDLLCGGAVLVAIVGVIALGVVAFCRK